MANPIPRKRRVGETITFEHPQTHVQSSGTVTRIWPEYNAVVVLTPHGERVVHESNITDRPRRDLTGVSTLLLESSVAGLKLAINRREAEGSSTVTHTRALSDFQMELAERAEESPADTDGADRLCECGDPDCSRPSGHAIAEQGPTGRGPPEPERVHPPPAPSLLFRAWLTSWLQA